MKNAKSDLKFLYLYSKIFKAIYLIMPIIIILYMICNKNKETNKLLISCCFCLGYTSKKCTFAIKSKTL